jgi:hypothetical protein
MKEGSLYDLQNIQNGLIFPGWFLSQYFIQFHAEHWMNGKPKCLRTESDMNDEKQTPLFLH